jgi:general secretion pathway protein A
MHSAESAPLPQSRHSVFANDDSRRPAFVSYFGLRENPFRSTSDPRYLLLTGQARKALDGLMEGISSRAGLLVLTGEVGAGKTVLLNRLLDLLRQQGTPRAFIFNSHLESDALFQMALADFGASPDLRTHASPTARLQQWLQDSYRASSNPVLIVDEAQGLKTEVLEAIRMLLNLETGSEKLLQIVLSGQPEFDTRINLPELRQLRQRIAVRYRLGALTLEETCLYIEHRLRVAGSAGESPFEPETLAAVHYYARGTPRVINALCEQALMKGCADRERPIPPKTIEEIAFQLQVDGHKPTGAPAQLGDLMMMNAVAARSRRAQAMSAESASASSSAASLQPELKIPEPWAGREETPTDPIGLAAGTARPEDSAATPVAPIALSVSALMKPVVEAIIRPVPRPASPVAPKEPSRDPIPLPVVAANLEDIVLTPASPVPASGPSLTKRAVVEVRDPPSRTHGPLPVRKVAVAAPRRSSTAVHMSKAQLSLAASLSSIERVASNWLRWLRQPASFNRGGTRGKTR